MKPSLPAREAKPPWQLAIAFVSLVAGRFISGRLTFYFWPMYLTVVQTAMTACAIVFWFWPVRTASSLLWRFIGVLCLVTLFFDIVLDLNPMVNWLDEADRFLSQLDLFRPNGSLVVFPTLTAATLALYNGLLAYPFAKLFWALRQNRELPLSTAFGTSAVFLFFAIATPGILQLVHFVRWSLIFVVPPIWVLTRLYLRDCRGTEGQPMSRGRALLRLVLLHTHWPILFFMSEQFHVALAIGAD
jgi:hypothetical protein